MTSDLHRCHSFQEVAEWLSSYNNQHTIIRSPAYRSSYGVVPYKTGVTGVQILQTQFKSSTTLTLQGTVEYRCEDRMTAAYFRWVLSTLKIFTTYGGEAPTPYFFMFTTHVENWPYIALLERLRGTEDDL